MYDYRCPNCSHEFDYNDGVRWFRDEKYIECPHCRADITEKVINDEEAYNNS